MTTFISAPFGNYLKFKNAVSVTGTWTYKPRPGLLDWFKKSWNRIWNTTYKLQ